IWMIECVKEVSRKPRIDPLLDPEDLEERDIRIPHAWSQVKRPWTWIVEFPNRCVAHRAVGQCLRQTVVEGRTKRPHHPLTAIYWHQRSQVAATYIGGLGRIEIATEPEPLPPAKDGHLQTLIRIKLGITKDITAGIHAPPQTTAPISDKGHLPAT